MGILVKKYQNGGSLFNVGKIDMGADDYSKFMSEYGAAATGGGRGSRAGAFGKTRSIGKTPAERELAALQGGLTSDINYYQTKKKELRDQMDSMLETDKEADKTPEYKELLNEFYELETQYLPAIKSMSKLYSTSKTAFGSAKAGNAPAIMGNQAIVYDTEEKKHKVIDAGELVRNATKYQLLTANEVLTKRADNPEFSGFTDLGKASMTLINNAYGQESFTDYIKDRTKAAGYIKQSGSVYKTPDGKTLDFRGGLEPGNATTKTNAGQLNILYNDLLTNNSSANNYVTAIAIQDLYTKAKTNNELYANLDDAKLMEELQKTKEQKLANNINLALIVDTKNGGTGGVNSLAFKDTKRNVMSLAALRLSKDNKTLEVPGIKVGDQVYSKLMNIPSSKVDKGGDLLEYGFKDINNKIKDIEEADNIADKNPYLRRTLDNNTFVNNLKEDNAEITTVDGTPIQTLVEDGNLQYITIPPKTQLHLMLAPVEVGENGKERVNFNSDEQRKIDEAIAESYKELEDAGYDAEAIQMDGDKELKQRAIALANKKLREKGVTGNLKIKMVAAFDVLYYSDKGALKYNYSITASDNEADYLDNINDDVRTSRVRKTKVFVPLSDSFFANMFASDALGSDFVRTLKYNDLMGMQKSSNESIYTPRSSAKAIAGKFHQNKEEGGKLEAPDEQEEEIIKPDGPASIDDVVKLLF
jgi:hypothetical protein